MRWRISIGFLCLSLLSACGGGGGADIIPTANIANVSLIEGDSGQKNMVFTVSLNGFLDDERPTATVNYSFQDGTAVSTGNNPDYIATSGRVTFQLGGATTQTFSVPIKGDTFAENDESFTVNLSVTGVLSLGSTSVTGTIQNDDGDHLNDTGITACSSTSAVVPSCPDSMYPGQDADRGRDAVAIAGTLAKLGGGRAGFDWTKLDAAGQPLASQTDTFATTPWDCIRDNVTGLVWEVKQVNAGGTLRDAANTYSWYNTTGVNDQGDPGTADGGTCAGSACDTESYVAAVNAAGLCGFSDWRLPSRAELRSIMDYSSTASGLKLDVFYFPNAVSVAYWSSSQVLGTATSAYTLGASPLGTSASARKSTAHAVRLVRGG